MASLGRARKTGGPTNGGGDGRQLRQALDAAERKLADADSRKTRAVTRATAELRRENEMLEAHLTRLVQEIGQMKTIVDRVERSEQEIRARDLRITELEEELERLRQALKSGRPTAIAAAAAAQAARPRRSPRR